MTCMFERSERSLVAPLQINVRLDIGGGTREAPRLRAVDEHRRDSYRSQAKNAVNLGMRLSLTR